eukprot:CAMPEP_0182844556 /NCGR_PEP_ID=MMETSP0006_2-20121128/26829_1 /TAXON_ID=97485 /ORGANISM="Prymnesium parvum, Strain Texoma1" /LENGTH=38 /DNA_ID= /DNA_START= /DNA_END= /DNA_ORIENTATION=
MGCLLASVLPCNDKRRNGREDFYQEAKPELSLDDYDAR